MLMNIQLWQCGLFEDELDDHFFVLFHFADHPLKLIKVKSEMAAAYHISLSSGHLSLNIRTSHGNKTRFLVSET